MGVNILLIIYSQFASKISIALLMLRQMHHFTVWPMFSLTKQLKSIKLITLLCIIMFS